MKNAKIASVLAAIQKKDYQEFGAPACAQYGVPSLYLVSPYSTFLTVGALSGYTPAAGEITAAFNNLNAIKRLNSDAYNNERGFVDVIDPKSGRIGPHLLSLDKGDGDRITVQFSHEAAGLPRNRWVFLGVSPRDWQS